MNLLTITLSFRYVHSFRYYILEVRSSDGLVQGRTLHLYYFICEKNIEKANQFIFVDWQLAII